MSEMQGSELKEAYWFNTHRNQIIRIAYGIGIALVSLLWLINVIMLIQWAMLQSSTNKAMVDLANTNVIYDSIKAPVDLQILKVDAVPHTDTTVDVYAVINNLNPYHVGSFSYTVTVNGESYSFTDGIVMPAASTNLVLSNLTGTALSSATITVDEVTWQRTRGAKVDATLLIADQLLTRSNLATGLVDETESTTEANTGSVDEGTANSNSSFARPDDITTTDTDQPTGKSITQLTARLTNASAYGYRTVRVTAYIKNTGGTVLGVQQQTLHDIASFADHNLTFNWQREFEFNATAEIIVETNYWSDTNLITPGE